VELRNCVGRKSKLSPEFQKEGKTRKSNPVGKKKLEKGPYPPNKTSKKKFKKEPNKGKKKKKGVKLSIPHQPTKNKKGVSTSPRLWKERNNHPLQGDRISRPRERGNEGKFVKKGRRGARTKKKISHEKKKKMFVRPATGRHTETKANGKKGGGDPKKVEKRPTINLMGEHTPNRGKKKNPSPRKTDERGKRR